MLVEQYLWNDHTTLVVELFEGLETAYPDIESWYEIKQGVEVMAAAGAAVIELGLHAWLGCPRNRELTEYLKHLGL